MQDAYGAIPQLPRDGAVERNVAQVRNLSPQIPEGVALGYHFCFGTLGGWPRFPPGRPGRDRGARECVRGGLGRRVDWIHIPLLDTPTRRSSRRSRSSSPAALASIWARSTIWSALRKLRLARRYFPDFGLAAYCGFGRSPVSALPGILDEHLQAAALAG